MQGRQPDLDHAPPDTMTNNDFNQYCERLLAQYNRRNTAATTRRIEELCNILRRQGDVVQTMFGGSVRRGTYVSGLSDVDVLLIVNQSSMANRPPADVIAYVKQAIEQQLPRNPVRAGNLAVTVNYSDGTEIQVLPAIRRSGGGVRIANPGNTDWSNVVRPDDFARRLVEVNQAKGSRVVPTIKLAKAIADCYISRSSRKIAGYHMEALAIEAFKDYHGGLDPKSMLVHLFGNSITAVMNPIADSTGQSQRVDEGLGPANSPARQRASTYFGQMRAAVRPSRANQDLDKLFCQGSNVA